MAESVDALVSNTSRFTPVPVRPRLWVHKERNESFSLFLLVVARADLWSMCVLWYGSMRASSPSHTTTPQANAYALAIKQSRCTHLKMRLRGYDSDILLDLFKVCAIFLAVSARVCDLKVAALRPPLWVYKLYREDVARILHRVVEGVGDCKRSTAIARVDLHREGIGGGREHRGGECQMPPIVCLLGC